MANMGIGVVVLAGGATTAAMRAATGASQRADVKIGGKTILNTTLDALTKSRAAGRIVVVGCDTGRSDVIDIPAGKTMIDNLMRGLTALATKDSGTEQDGAHVLVLTCDMPFITREAINDFVFKATEADATLAYPVIPMAVYRSKFSSLKRTTLRIKEGEFTGGNMALLRPDVFLMRRPQIEAAYAARKSVTKLALMLGPLFLLRLMLAKFVSPIFLNIGALEVAVANTLGPNQKAKAIITKFAEIGADADRAEDVAPAEAIWRRLHPEAR